MWQLVQFELKNSQPIKAELKSLCSHILGQINPMDKEKTTSVGVRRCSFYVLLLSSILYFMFGDGTSYYLCPIYFTSLCTQMWDILLYLCPLSLPQSVSLSPIHFSPVLFIMQVVKHETLTQCWANVGSLSTTLIHH